jgi:hypothetical protein
MRSNIRVPRWNSTGTRWMNSSSTSPALRYCCPIGGVVGAPARDHRPGRGALAGQEGTIAVVRPSLPVACPLVQLLAAVAHGLLPPAGYRRS